MIPAAAPPAPGKAGFRPFIPAWFSRGGHVQTILGYVLRRSLRWTLPAEDLLVDSEPDIKILSRATWQQGDRARSPALILLHGMGGWDHSTYMLSMGLHAFAVGYHVIRMNMRGAGRSFEVCPRLYNAGLEGIWWRWPSESPGTSRGWASSARLSAPTMCSSPWAGRNRFCLPR